MLLRLVAILAASKLVTGWPLLNADAEVSATASGWGLQIFREKLSQVAFFDYKTDDVAADGAGDDAVYDTVGSDRALTDSFKATKPNGHVLSIVARSHRDPGFVYFFNQASDDAVQTLLMA
ncbi:zinc-binding dehydrogenase [Weissella cibaria]|uniref:Uncharacterized protein n=1 Tax=Weissella cibaria TaxID=137591 RepID=A0A0D1LVS8_9LACO|nr:zinc-binding dehydrogenase [Weissella cibaria]KIU23960.1 hypothetical protein ab3b_01341 [Weissella cibaria]